MRSAMVPYLSTIHAHHFHQTTRISRICSRCQFPRWRLNDGKDRLGPLPPKTLRKGSGTFWGVGSGQLGGLQSS